MEHAGKEAEVRPLLEVGTHLLVRLSQDKDNNGEDLGQVVDLCLFVVGAAGIRMVLDQVDNELRKGIDRREDATCASSANRMLLSVCLLYTSPSPRD